MAELLTKASYSKKMNEREKQNLLVAYRAACEGIVLLENDGVLPLKNKEIALFGAGASRTIKGGSGSGEVNERHSITILEGLEKAGFDIETEKWIADYERAYIEGKDQFEKDKRNYICLPESLFTEDSAEENENQSPIMLCLTAECVENNLKEDGGVLHVSYSIEVNGITAEVTDFTLTATPGLQ